MTNEQALEALGEPTRRAIFEHLSERACGVGSLAQLVPVSRPAVSQHLKVLKAAGLVIEDRTGTKHIYRLDPEASLTCGTTSTGSGAAPWACTNRKSR